MFDMEGCASHSVPKDRHWFDQLRQYQKRRSLHAAQWRRPARDPASSLHAFNYKGLVACSLKMPVLREIQCCARVFLSDPCSIPPGFNPNLKKYATPHVMSLSQQKRNGRKPDERMTLHSIIAKRLISRMPPRYQKERERERKWQTSCYAKLCPLG